MKRSYEEPTVNEYDAECHPAWATIHAHRGTSTPGVNLFDSDILHQHTVRITIHEANRRRDLHHDWIHGSKVIAEVELSEAQWASFVSAMNSGSGVPCTLRYNRDGSLQDVPDFPHQPRLAETMAETHAAAENAFDDIKQAFAVLEAATTAKEKREAMHTLKHTIGNATPNVDFAGKQLIEHAEDVVQKVKADVEAFVTTRARQLGLDPTEVFSLDVGAVDTGQRALEGGQ